MTLPTAFVNRRHFLRGSLALGLTAFTAAGAFAEELARTPRLTEGPFYPPKLPLDTDNDLLIINDKITPAVGEVTHLTGRILSPGGEPVRNAAVPGGWPDGRESVSSAKPCPDALSRACATLMPTSDGTSLVSFRSIHHRTPNRGNSVSGSTTSARNVCTDAWCNTSLTSVAGRVARLATPPANCSFARSKSAPK